MEILHSNVQIHITSFVEKIQPYWMLPRSFLTDQFSVTSCCTIIILQKSIESTFLFLRELYNEELISMLAHIYEVYMIGRCLHFGSLTIKLAEMLQDSYLRSKCSIRDNQIYT